jgi:hypothetical protein
LICLGRQAVVDGVQLSGWVALWVSKEELKLETALTRPLCRLRVSIVSSGMLTLRKSKFPLPSWSFLLLTDIGLPRVSRLMSHSIIQLPCGYRQHSMCFLAPTLFGGCQGVPIHRRPHSQDCCPKHEKRKEAMEEQQWMYVYHLTWDLPSIVSAAGLFGLLFCGNRYVQQIEQN